MNCFRPAKQSLSPAVERPEMPSGKKVVLMVPMPSIWRRLEPYSRMLKNPLYAGMSLVAIGAMLRSLQGLCVAFLARRGYRFWTITCFHGVSGSVFCILLAMAKSPDGVRSLVRPAPGNGELLFLRSLLGGVTVITAFYAVTYMDLGQATVIMATSPLFTAAMLSCFDEGTWSLSNTVAAITCLIGMMLMTKSPPFSRSNQAFNDLLPGLLASFGSALSMAGINVIVRRIPKEDLILMSFYGMVGSLVLALPGCMQEQLAPIGPRGVLSYANKGFWIDLLLLCIPGLVGCWAVLVKTYALQICHVVSILVILYLEPICALFWDWTVLGAVIDLMTLVGVLTIIVGCVVSVLSDTQSHHYSHHHGGTAESELEMEKSHCIGSVAPGQKRAIAHGG